MSDAENTADAGDTTPETEGKQFTPPESQEELDRIIQKRIERERSRFKDYDELKAKASKLDEIEAANQTEAEKAQARIAELERQIADANLTALRSEIAASKGVPAGLLTGTTEDEITASADALLDFRGEQKPAAPRSSAFKNVGAEGAGQSTANQFADFFNSHI